MVVTATTPLFVTGNCKFSGLTLQYFEQQSEQTHHYSGSLGQ